MQWEVVFWWNLLVWWWLDLVQLLELMFCQWLLLGDFENDVIWLGAGPECLFVIVGWVVNCHFANIVFRPGISFEMNFIGLTVAWRCPCWPGSRSRQGIRRLGCKTLPRLIGHLSEELRSIFHFGRCDLRRQHFIRLLLFERIHRRIPSYHTSRRWRSLLDTELFGIDAWIDI